MKLLLSLAILSTVFIGCSHTKKQKKEIEPYSPIITFTEGDELFTSKVQLPKNKFETKIPLVVIVHEWWGRTPYIEGRAEMLNKEGFATLAVDLYGNAQTAQTPTDAQELASPFYQDAQLGINRLNKYIEAAKNDPHIDASQVFVIGYCFGGTQALNLARSGADIKGVVSFHGGLTAGLPAHDVKAKILAINGLADPMVPTKDRKAFEEEMKSANADYKVVNYRGATHAFTNPGATEIGKKYKMPIAYNRKADLASWKELLGFLRQ